MKAKARKSCPNCGACSVVGCSRGAVEGALRPLSPVSRRNLLRHGRIPRPPPSHRPLTSSSRPSLSRRKVRSNAVSADNLVTPSTNAPPSPRSRSTARSVDYRLDLCPCCGHHLQPMPTILPRVIQQVDIKDVPLEVQEHRGHPGWWSHCQRVQGALAHQDRRRRAGGLD